MDGAISLSGTGTLKVSGLFTNTALSTITNTAGGFGRLQLTASQPVTNQGVITFLSAGGNGASGNTGLVVQVGSAGALNTFYNAGTMTLGFSNRVTVLSNQFVNATTG